MHLALLPGYRMLRVTGSGPGNRQPAPTLPPPGPERTQENSLTVTPVSCHYPARHTTNGPVPDDGH